MTPAAALRLAAAIALSLVALAAPVSSEQMPGHFILALSWSPSFCATPEAEDEHLQCRSGRRFGFIVHGLWPQSDGALSEYCPTRERWVPEQRIADMLPIMPSRSLILHQWRKHGTCSGLTMADYFALTKELHDRIEIPQAYSSPRVPLTVARRKLLADMVEANPGLEPGMIELACTRGRQPRLTELRICFSRAGRFAQCRSRRSGDCRAKTLVLPPATGNGF